MDESSPRTRSQRKAKKLIIKNSASRKRPSTSPQQRSSPSAAGRRSSTKCPSMSHELSEWVEKFQSLPRNSQIEALEKLVEVCPSTHLRHLHTIVEPHLQRDFISELPREVAKEIISNLDVSNLLNAARVSRTWRIVCEDNLLWREKCMEAGVSDEIEPPVVLWNKLTSAHLPKKEKKEEKDDNAEDEVEEEPKPEAEAEDKQPRRPVGSTRCYERARYKSLYLRQRLIRSHWLKNNPAAQCHIPCHEEHVITGLEVNGDVIATASDDTTICIWSAASAECVFTLKGHVGGVWTLLLTNDGTHAISGSTDRTVRVWNLKTGEAVHVLNGHTSTVRCMALHDKILVTGSRDCTVRVWDLDSGVQKMMLISHYAAVRCVQFDGKKIVSGSYDSKISVFDAITGERLHLLTGHQNRVYSLLMDSERSLCVSGSLDASVRIWNIDEGSCLHTLLGHQSLTSGMQLHGNMLVSANADSTIKVWDIVDGCCVHTLAGPNRHNSAVTSLQFLYDDYVVTSSDDGTVKMWDVRNGVFVCNLVQLATERVGGCVWRLKATPTMLYCAVGSRNGSEDTKLIMLDFDVPYP